MSDLIKALTGVIRPGGEPIMGNALMKQESIATLRPRELAPLIRQELGLERENKLIDKKIEAAKDPEAYFKNRKERQNALSIKIAEFINTFTSELGKAGFTAEETGIIARHIANELGNVLRVTLEAEYPMEFARKGIEDLLNKKYR